VGRLLSGIAHELNTPIGTLVVASEELVAILQSEPATSDAADLAKTIAGESARVAGIVDSLRANIRNFSIDEGDVLALVRDLARPHKTRILVECVGQPCAGWIAETHRPSLERILYNFVENADQATVSARSEQPVIVMLEGGPEHIVLRVRDAAGGIRDDIAADLGSPFVTTKPDGMGLGIYISRLLARQLGVGVAFGQIEGGTEVRLEIPVVWRIQAQYLGCDAGAQMSV